MITSVGMAIIGWYLNLNQLPISRHEQMRGFTLSNVISWVEDRFLFSNSFQFIFFREEIFRQSNFPELFKHCYCSQ